MNGFSTYHTSDGSSPNTSHTGLHYFLIVDIDVQVFVSPRALLNALDVCKVILKRKPVNPIRVIF